MKKRMPYVPWLITVGVALLMFCGVAAIRGVLNQTEPAVVLSGLCDAFFVPGALLLCFGLLGFCSRGGVFDMLSYGVHSLLVLFTPFKKPEKHVRYYEYKLMREARRQKPKPYTLIVGLCCMALAGVCLIFYYQAA